MLVELSYIRQLGGVLCLYSAGGTLFVYSAGGALLYNAGGALNVYSAGGTTICSTEGAFCISVTNRNINELELGGALTAYEDLLPSSVWSQSGILPTRAVINAVSSGARSSDVWRTSWWLARVELSYDVTTLLVMREKPKIRRPQ